jgi:2-dehydropantoate 2-reductase
LSIEKEKNNNDNNVSKVIILSNGALAIRDAIYKRFGCDRTTTTTCDDDGRTMIDGVQIVLASTTHGAYRNNPSTSSSLLLNNHFVNNTTNDKKYTTNDNDEEGVGYYDITHAGIGTTTSSYIEFINALYHSSSTSIIGGRTGNTLHSVSNFDMELALWRKLAVNCVVNPLTAIHNIHNGTLLDTLIMCNDKQRRQEHVASHILTMQNQMRGILQEVSDVAIREMKHSCNHHRNNNNSLSATATTMVEESLSVPSLEEFTYRVMSDTRNNISSMLQDVKAGRRTEIQYINGYITSLGKEKYNIDCPYNTEMCRLLMGS